MPRPWLLASAALLLCATGCQRESTTPLIQVRDLAPHTAELGDRIHITGQGFPEGKVAHVTFHGDLHRPRSEAIRGVDVTVDAVAISATEVELPLDEALASSFAGSGEQATHTTFSGDVTVSFAAVAPAAPPVAGTLRETWLDLRPPSPRLAAAEAETAEGTRTLAFLGITPDPTPLPAGGVLVRSVERGSRAEAARILPKDAIVEVDGVRVLSVRDVIPAAGERIAWLKIRRDGSPREEPADVSLVGLAPPPGAALLWPSVVLGVATLVLLLLFAPRLSTLAWLERRLARGVRARSSPRRLGLDAALVYAPLLLVASACRLLASDVDVATPFLVAAAVLVWAGAAPGGSRPWAERSRAAGRALTLLVPAAACVLATIVTTGSFGLADLVRAQGGAPWRWTMFQSPLAAGLVSAWTAAEVLRAVPRGGSTRGGFGGLLADLAGAAMITLMTALFLGGWQVPGVAPELAGARLGWTLLGACLFVAKACGVGAGIRAAARAFPLPSRESEARFAWRTLIPASFALLLATPAWLAWGPAPNMGMLVSLATLGLVVAVSLPIAARVFLLVRDRAPEPSLDPFL